MINILFKKPLLTWAVLFVGLIFSVGYRPLTPFLLIAVVIYPFLNVSMKVVNEQKVKQQEKHDQQQDVISFINKSLEEKNFHSKKQFFSTDSKLFVSIDDETNRICFIEDQSNNEFQKLEYLQQFIFDNKDLLKSEIIEDETSITSTSRGSQIGGIIAGSVLAGGIGAIIGGLSASSTTNVNVKKIELRILVNNIENPIHTIKFLNESSPISKNNDRYKVAIEEANVWHGLISILIKRADDRSNIS